MTFNEVLSQTIAMLQQHGRVSYRALKRQFALDDAFLDDLKYELTEVQPAEYRADAVVVLLDRDVPVRVIIIEVQLAVDPRKRFSWPAYVTVRVPSMDAQRIFSSSLPIPALPDGAQSPLRSASRASSCARLCCAAPPFQS